jgi:1-deoxy-D-xylulose-5-phosphate reductoisomerase
MNKGLELIEAHHLFRVPLARIDVVIHPQAVIHSLVEFVDGSAKAQLSNPDMRLPIGLALSYPDRLPGVVAPTAFPTLGRLELLPPDGDRFPSVRLAERAARAGAPYPAVLNAANEEAVAAFVEGGLRFSGIVAAVAAALDAYTGPPATGLEEILEADRFARRYVKALARVGR